MKTAQVSKVVLSIAPILALSLALSISTKSEVLATSGSHKAEHKVNICHKTGSASHPWEAINVDVKAFDGEGHNDHTQHGDFLYSGPVDKNGHPTKEGNSWCGPVEDKKDHDKDDEDCNSCGTDEDENDEDYEGPSTSQSQSQEQSQTVNVQVLGAHIPKVLPATGLNPAALALMLGVVPFGVVLARYKRSFSANKRA